MIIQGTAGRWLYAAFHCTRNMEQNNLRLGKVQWNGHSNRNSELETQDPLAKKASLMLFDC